MKRQLSMKTNSKICSILNGVMLNRREALCVFPSFLLIISSFSSSFFSLSTVVGGHNNSIGIDAAGGFAAFPKVHAAQTTTTEFAPQSNTLNVLQSQSRQTQEQQQQIQLPTPTSTPMPTPPPNFCPINQLQLVMQLLQDIQGLNPQVVFAISPALNTLQSLLSSNCRLGNASVFTNPAPSGIFANSNQNDVKAAECNLLNEFINQVNIRTQYGQITPSQAAYLIGQSSPHSAQQIGKQLGCFFSPNANYPLPFMNSQQRQQLQLPQQRLQLPQQMPQMLSQPSRPATTPSPTTIQPQTSTPITAAPFASTLPSTTTTPTTTAAPTTRNGNGTAATTIQPLLVPMTNLYDDFDGTATYTLADGQTSPNGKWHDIYNGHGAAGTRYDWTGSGNKVFFMYPLRPTSPSQTSASLVVSTQSWSNFDMNINTKTVKQLRLNSPPNPWETAWIFFRYTDTFHYYAFLVKPNGIEFDKKDCNTCTDPVQGQQFLVTASSPTLNIGTWSNWKISAIGNHIIITIDGIKVIDYIDQTMSPQLARGSIGMYNEDAYAQFDNVYVTPK
jgi:hypothetical protein